MSKKSNWNILRRQKPTETTKFRNVHEDQQLERSELDQMQNMTGRTIIAVSVGLLVMLLVWFFVSLVQMLTDGKGELEMNPSPENTWIHVAEHYVNVNDQSDVISVEDYEALVQMHKDIQSGKVQEVENPGDPPVIQAERGPDPETSSIPGFHITIPEGALMPDNSRCSQETQMFLPEADYNDYIARVNAEYQLRYDAWKQYSAAKEDPSETYTYQVAHYRNRNDFSQYIKEDEYEAQMAEYNGKVSSVKEGSKFADESSVPLLPFDPSTLYSSYERGTVDPYTYNPQVYMSEEESAAFQTYLSEHRLQSSEGAAYTAMAGTVFFDQAPPEELTSLFDRLNASVGDRAVTYKNTLDGTVIPYTEYDALVAKYQSDIAAFKTAYTQHRESFHPDDIDGTAKIFSLAPNKVKVEASLLIGLIVFAVLETILFANLRKENSSADTTDINQYHNDQHIALPEEIQEHYDFFPDVGAHSAVQVSSMISHMALLNKGLKTVQIAVRADKDIVNEDGDIEYYKGEILEDGNGNPVTKKANMIDTSFMEALFDASGAPKNKEIRKYYDATKIPYNADGSDRDKLGQYAHWSDVINADWEFPLYEPQRPAGAYVVDTAPVNTIQLLRKAAS